MWLQPSHKGSTAVGRPNDSLFSLATVDEMGRGRDGQTGDGEKRKIIVMNSTKEAKQRAKGQNREGRL